MRWDWGEQQFLPFPSINAWFWNNVVVIKLHVIQVARNYALVCKLIKSDNGVMDMARDALSESPPSIGR